MGAIGKVSALVALNMRWERAMFDRELAEHPWELAGQLVRDAATQLSAWEETLFIQGSDEAVGSAPPPMEDRHQDLFQTLWVNFSADDYRDRVARYVHRLEVNELAGGFLEGRRCIDFGCGHGNFAHALLEKGAESVLGIDYGENSIRYAEAARDRLGVPPERLQFRVESVYEVAEPDGSFGFAIQNGVFHHLDDEDRAYREMHRVLEPGGWIWVYTDGAGGVSYDLWDASVRMLRELPAQFVLEVLDFLGVETNKRYHLGDGLNATYRHTSWEEITDRLGGMGFGNFRRLVGGFPTDFDHDVIEADPWGREKFGEGDLRLLAQKLG
jgi:SAM-dependent methyltransferase